VAKLDTDLRGLVVQKEFFDKNPSAGGMSIGPDEPLYVAVKFIGSVSTLKSAGLEIAEIAGDFAYGKTNLTGLVALDRDPQVISVEKQRRHRIHLDDSVPELKADQVWSRSGDNFTGYTGKDVIVGIIDTGIDFRHAAFQHADGTTRIHKIWDQTLTAQGGETVPGPINRASLLDTPGTPIALGYGVEYDVGQIKAAITDDASAPIKARHKDDDGHGSHVAGIAAGDGSQSGSCHGAFHYIGVATDATLIVVRKWRLSDKDSKTPPTSTNTMLDAIRYVINEARQLNKPVVINLSLGFFSERMDGSDNETVTVDRLLTNNSTGTAIVFSAGNDGNENFHANATVPAGPTAILELKFKVSKDDTKERDIVILYSGSNLQVKITSPVGGAAGTIGFLVSGLSIVSITANGSSGNVTLSNQPNRIDIIITPGTGDTNADGEWSLEFKDSGSTATVIDGFCLFGSSHDDKSPHFLDHTTSRNTLDANASGKESISVGSYRLAGVFHGSRLSDFSSRGPTTDSPPRVKPDICAPGEDITSVGIAKDRGGCQRCCCNSCRSFYVDLSGTSMSAPHVTGLIALMLHKNPNLTHTEIKNLLTANFAPKPAGSTPDEDVGWGAGRADAKKTVDTVTQVNPPVSKVAAALPPVTAVHKTFLETERGPILDKLFHDHADEVWELIQKNRRVATVWHRCRGPVWVRFALKAAQTPCEAVPLETEGLRFTDACTRFAQALKRFGSEALRRDVKIWESEVSHVRDGMTLLEIITAVGNRPNTLMAARSVG